MVIRWSQSGSAGEPGQRRHIAADCSPAAAGLPEPNVGFDWGASTSSGVWGRGVHQIGHEPIGENSAKPGTYTALQLCHSIHAGRPEGK